jgi:hypothetical protein
MGIRSSELAGDPALDLVHQHLAVDHAEAVFFGEVLDLDDGWHFFGKMGNAKCRMWNGFRELLPRRDAKLKLKLIADF